MGDSWFERNVYSLKSFMRIAFGVVWLIDGILKFRLTPSAFSSMITTVGEGQPGWMLPWFSFWSRAVTVNPALFLYVVAVSETLLGLALILGAVRKPAYLAGIALSLLIWSVPEGFGGPYGPGSTDIGTGIIYAFVFIFLLIVNAGYGPSRLSVDYFIEKKYPKWRRVAETG
jgi:nitrite reductase (NO-forming)